MSLAKLNLAKFGVEITSEQLSLLEAHQNMVLETNKHMNLTAITDIEEFAVKHILDSLTLLPYLKQGARLCDVGSGAGFPGIVLGIMRKDLHVMLVDSLRKRVTFLQSVVDRLSLTNVEAVHTRAEDLAREGISFDICTARAVARMDKLVKYALPITAPGGVFLAMKGPNVEEELEAALSKITKLHGAVERINKVELVQGLVHSIVVIRKNL